MTARCATCLAWLAHMLWRVVNVTNTARVYALVASQHVVAGASASCALGGSVFAGETPWIALSASDRLLVIVVTQ